MSFIIMEIFDQAVFFVYQRFHKLLTFRHSLHLTIVLKLVFFLDSEMCTFLTLGGVKTGRLGVGVEIAPNFLNFCHSESVARDDLGY